MAAKKKKDEKTKKKTKKTSKTSSEKVKNLEKKVGDLSKYINSTNEYIQQSSKVITTLAGSPELTKQFQGELQKRYGGEGAGKEQGQNGEKGKTTDTPSGKDEERDRKIEQVSLAQRDKIVRDFEEETGIDQLKGEKKTETKRKIESFLNDFGYSIKTAPLTSLRKNLNQAYLGTNLDKLKEEGKLKGLVQGRANQKGVMGTIGGTTPAPSSGKKKITDKQKGWAKSLGVDEEKAEKTYLKRDEEQTRVSASEKKTKK